MSLASAIRRNRTRLLRMLFFGIIAICSTAVIRYAIYRTPKIASYKEESSFDYEAFAAQSNSTSQKCDLKPCAVRYGIVFDAGSTGSRVHVYKYSKNTKRRKITLHSEESMHITPGLSSYRDPEEAALSLKPLLDFTMEKVPKNRQNKCTPIWLRATAGLRLVGVENSVAILHAVHSMFSMYPFELPDDAVEMMDGKDEGPLAWLTVNFLLGNLHKKPNKSCMKAKKRVRANATAVPATVGVVDMGGGSTQVVFAPDEPVDTLHYAPDVNTHVIHYFDRQFSLYQHSYLGFGLVEAREAIIKLLASRSGPTNSDGLRHVPCLPPGYLEEVRVVHNATRSHIGTGTQIDHSHETVEKVAVQGTSQLYGFEQCLPYVHDALNKSHPCPTNSCSFNGVHQPTLEHAFKGDWYLMSKFYDLAAKYMEEAKKDHLELEDYRQIAVAACKRGIFEDAEEPYLCIDTTFLYVLLAQGYELPETQPLYPRNRINGIELSWTLGMMIEEIA